MNTKTRLNSPGIRYCLLLILVLSACKKHQPTPEPPPGEGGKPESPTPLQPQQIGQAQLEIKLTYSKAGGLLLSFEQSDGLTEKFIYTNQQQLTTYQRYQKDELIYFVDYYFDGNEKMIHAAQHAVKLNGKVTTPIGYYDIQLNADRKISDVKWYGLNNELLKTFVYNYGESGMLNTIVSTNPEIKQITYTYDNKNGLFKNVAVAQFLALENNLFMLHCTAANILKQTGSGLSASTSYTYDTGGFPLTINTKDEKGTQTAWKVTY